MYDAVACDSQYVFISTGVCEILEFRALCLKRQMGPIIVYS